MLWIIRKKEISNILQNLLKRDFPNFSGFEIPDLAAQSLDGSMHILSDGLYIPDACTTRRKISLLDYDTVPFENKPISVMYL